MTTDHEQTSLQHIEMCRRISRRAAEQFRALGVEADDVAIAAIYAAHDLAMDTGRNPHEAIDWLRTALDLQEAQLMDTVPQGPVH